MQHDTWHKAGTGRTHIRPFATEVASTEKLSNQLLLHDEPNATIPKALLESIVFVSSVPSRVAVIELFSSLSASL